MSRPGWEVSLIFYDIVQIIINIIEITWDGGWAFFKFRTVS